MATVERAVRHLLDDRAARPRHPRRGGPGCAARTAARCCRSSPGHEDSFRSRLDQEAEGEAPHRARDRRQRRSPARRSSSTPRRTSYFAVERDARARASTRRCSTNSLPLDEPRGRSRGLEPQARGPRRLVPRADAVVRRRRDGARDRGLLRRRVVFSVKGISGEGFLTDPDPLETEVKRAMIGAGRDGRPGRDVAQVRRPRAERDRARPPRAGGVPRRSAGGGHADARRGRRRDHPRLTTAGAGALSPRARPTRTRRAARCTPPAPPGTAGGPARDDLEARARDAAGELAAEALGQAEVELADGHERGHRDRVDAVVAVVLDSASAERQNASTDCAFGLSAAAVSHSSIVPSL